VAGGGNSQVDSRLTIGAAPMEQAKGTPETNGGPTPPCRASPPVSAARSDEVGATGADLPDGFVEKIDGLSDPLRRDRFADERKCAPDDRHRLGDPVHDHPVQVVGCAADDAQAVHPIHGARGADCTCHSGRWRHRRADGAFLSDLTPSRAIAARWRAWVASMSCTVRRPSASPSLIVGPLPSRWPLRSRHARQGRDDTDARPGTGGHVGVQVEHPCRRRRPLHQAFRLESPRLMVGTTGGCSPHLNTTTCTLIRGRP